MLGVTYLSERGRAPARSSQGAIGYDLHSAENCIVPSGERRLVPLDIALTLPPGTYGRIAPRSGLALKHGICVGAGVIDPDYRGNVCVLLFNHGQNDFTVSQGDRIAQLILEEAKTVPVHVMGVDEEEKEEKEEEEEECNGNENVRGRQGFGSTGVRQQNGDEKKENKVVCMGSPRR